MHNNNRQSQTTKIISNDFHCDAIGKPDPITNLRPMKYYVPESETTIEKLYRIERMRVEEWNDRFWRQHNEMFKKERDEFRLKHVCAKNSNPADELSKFYKDFLDRNWKTHCQYNFEWYRKNFYLSSLALRVNANKFLRYFKVF